MPIEKREPNAKAKLFVPTLDEKSTRQKSRNISKSLEEVESLKKELQDLIKQQKESK